VSASKSEGLPNAVLEAMACGLRLALTDIGPHRELLELAPDRGEVAALGDVSALAAAIGRVAMSAPAVEVLAGASLEGLLGAERMAKQYQELYRRIARGQVAA
jgi:glycosyltransferase involved in cell wall biosynthesis